MDMRPVIKKSDKSIAINAGTEGVIGSTSVSKEEVQSMIKDATDHSVERFADIIKEMGEKREDKGVGRDDSNTYEGVLSSKTLREIKMFGEAWSTLRDALSDPITKKVQEKAGGIVAEVVDNAFQAPVPREKNFVDTILNSQFAFGLGKGIGERTPELVETMGRTFGAQKTEQLIDNIMGRYNPGTGGSGGSGGSGLSSSVSGMGANPNPKTGGGNVSREAVDKQIQSQKDIEIILSLDYNNPEHVSAYADFMGGLPVDAARTQLMMHQDGLIKQLESKGMVVKRLPKQQDQQQQIIEKVEPQPIETNVQEIEETDIEREQPEIEVADQHQVVDEEKEVEKEVEVENIQNIQEIQNKEEKVEKEERVEKQLTNFMREIGVTISTELAAIRNDYAILQEQINTLMKNQNQNQINQNQINQKDEEKKEPTDFINPEIINPDLINPEIKIPDVEKVKESDPKKSIITAKRIKESRLEKRIIFEKIRTCKIIDGKIEEIFDCGKFIPYDEFMSKNKEKGDFGEEKQEELI